MNGLTASRSVIQRETFTVREMNDAIALLWKFHHDRHTGPVTVNMSEGGIVGMSAETRRIPLDSNSNSVIQSI